MNSIVKSEFRKYKKGGSFQICTSTKEAKHVKFFLRVIYEWPILRSKWIEVPTFAGNGPKLNNILGSRMNTKWNNERSNSSDSLLLFQFKWKKNVILDINIYFSCALYYIYDEIISIKILES